MNEVALLSFATVFCCLVQNWYLAKANMMPTYLWGLAGALLCFSLDIVLVVKDDTNYGVLAFCLLAAWQAVMCLRGIKRERGVAEERRSRVLVPQQPIRE